MKKAMFLASSSLLLSFLVISPAFAINKSETTDKATDTTITTTHKNGYTTKSYSGGKEKITPNVEKKVSALSTSSFSMKRGKYADFYDESLKSYSDGKLKTFSSIDVDYTDTSISTDYISIKGYTKAHWSGGNPYNADRITVLPAQTISASGAATAYSYPAAVSVNSTSGALQFSWPSEYDDNSYGFEYDWDKITSRVKGSGKFTGVIVNDVSNFKFGSKTTSVLNTLDISIN
ncbi:MULTISPECIES: hypothetical protein [Brevibacillus]|uniref:Uncharacterized protein n=1 Tax=Brevibacillus parabrevis TaxID=54914 RepID=A0A4Y3PRF1_BREPA|nr:MULTISPECIES: hypothetical protein [Brevibacillus]RNB93295.1 hypothetical protein EDM60_23155 [Brevibacillus parabrevis]GEB33968.1 hypothetical protein BPA01_35480 [Brevibacillus parabrevis]HBZ82788.1 hypothetical protein [Brevibacillus sp.]